MNWLPILGLALLCALLGAWVVPVVVLVVAVPFLLLRGTYRALCKFCDEVLKL